MTQTTYIPWLPFFTLLRREVWRFLMSPAQTIFAPIITSSLFLFVFGINMGGRIQVSQDYTYAQFVIPGLVLMGVITSSFAQSSTSLFFSRYIGNIVDLLVTPISSEQMILAYTFAAMIRGLIVGIAVMVVSSFFSSLPWSHPWHVIAMGALTSFALSQLGLVAALYSDTFEAISMYTNFLLLPLLYFGGMFYPIETLPPFWRTISHFNPLFYFIDGFRQSLLGHGDNSLALDFACAGGISFALFAWAYLVFAKGRKLRA